MSTAIDNALNFPFTDQELTEAINILPNQYGRLESMGMFPIDPISSTIVEIRIEEGVLTLLPAKARGAPATPAARNLKKSLFLEVPHIPHLDTIKPSDIQNMNQVVARSRGKVTLDSLMNKRLADMRSRHDLTLEFMRMAALKGVLLDGAGATLYDFFTEFAVVKKSVAFALGTGTTDVLSKCDEVVAHIENNAGGEVIGGVEALVDSAFFNKLIDHAKVKDKYVNWQAAQAMSNPKREDATGGATGRVFPFGAINFREARGSVTPFGGSATPFVAASTGHAFPIGTRDTFVTYSAPPNRVDAANVAPDEVISITTEILKHGQGVEMRSESNVLPLVRRPALIVELTTN